MSYEVKVNMKSLSRVRLLAAPWTVAYQASLSMGFPGQNTGADCHFLLQGIVPPRDGTQVSRIEGRCFTLWATREALFYDILSQKNSEEWLSRNEGKKANERRIFQQVTKVYNWSLRPLQKYEFCCEAQL